MHFKLLHFKAEEGESEGGPLGLVGKWMELSIDWDLRLGCARCWQMVYSGHLSYNLSTRKGLDGAEVIEHLGAQTLSLSLISISHLQFLSFS